MKRYLLLFALALPLFNIACRETGSDAEDSTNPYFAQAEKFSAEENYNAAIEQYEKALQANPKVVKAYEEMGHLYSEKLGDPVSAIYCYKKYLRARPDAEDRELVANYIEKATHDFALTLPTNITPTVGEDFARLNSGTAPVENTAVSATTADIQPQTQPQAQTPAPANHQSGAKSYTVQKGDSLWKIARKFYPDDVKGGVEKIKQANPEAANNDKGLKLGATLVIP